MAKIILTIVSLSMFVIFPGMALAQCKNSIFNPVTDVAWNGLFPIRVSGAPLIKNNSLPDSSDGTDGVLCSCTSSTSTYIGVQASFWDIGYMAEVVKDAYCSPVIGTALSGSDDGFHGGTNDKQTDAPHTFKQVHWIKFPVMNLLGVLADMQCLENGDLAYANMTELDPTYPNDFLAALKDPKTFLVANPAADIACAASNVQALVPGGGFTPAFDSLFWCWWDNVYPLSGNVGLPHDLTSSAQLAARQIMFFYEFGGLMDHVANYCQGSASLIPKKSQWRFQLAKPVKNATPFWPGLSELVWGTGKNPAFRDSNFLYVLFQKKRCCQKLKGA